MMSTNDINRTADHVYVIDSVGPYFYTGTVSNGTQVLIVAFFPEFISIQFDTAGHIQHVERHPLSPETQESGRIPISGDLHDPGDEALRGWMHAARFEQGPIRVKRFFLPGESIGINDFPDIFRNTLKNESQHDWDDVNIARLTLQRWMDEGTFELWLNEKSNVWIKGNGEIDSQ